MQIFLEDSHTRESTICHLTTTAAADAAVAVDGEAAAAVVAVAAVADAAAAVVAAAADAAGDAAGPLPLVCPTPVFQVHLSSSSPAR